jgi:ABC-type lipoprotein export system ATPase subunit
MIPMTSRTLRLTIVLQAMHITASACNVPVFRYALERGPLSPYVAVVIADANLLPLGSGERAARRASPFCFVVQRFHLIRSRNVEQNMMASCVARPVEYADERCNELMPHLGLLRDFTDGGGLVLTAAHDSTAANAADYRYLFRDEIVEPGGLE